MALINCPECQKEMSDTSKLCMNCGYKFNKKKLLINNKIIIATGSVFVVVFIVIILFVTGIIGNDLGDPYIGLIPNTTHFNAKCTAADGSLIVEFKEDGTFIKKIDLFGLRAESFYGIYERKGNIIEVKFDDGGYIKFIVKNNSLYESQ